VRGLPNDLQAAVFVVVHIPSNAPSALAGIISRAAVLPTLPAPNGELVQPGRIYVAPPGCHLLLAENRIRLATGPKENGHRPAVDPLFRTAADVYGPRVIGVVLSGSQNDGTAGLLSIRRAGGTAVIQDPDSALYPSMPRSALEHAGADHVLPVEQMAALLVRLTSEPVPAQEAQDTMTDEDFELQEIEDEEALVQQDRASQPGIPSTQTCPECHGTLWEVQDSGILKFRCRVGHSYTAEALAGHQAEQLEAALWTALRALEEHGALARRLAARALGAGHTHSAARFTEEAMDAEHHASVVRTVLDENSERIPAMVVTEPEPSTRLSR
jgi:two-component system chemotaxis response regulator CheB